MMWMTALLTWRWPWWWRWQLRLQPVRLSLAHARLYSPQLLSLAALSQLRCLSITMLCFRLPTKISKLPTSLQLSYRGICLLEQVLIPPVTLNPALLIPVSYYTSCLLCALVYAHDLFTFLLQQSGSGGWLYADCCWRSSSSSWACCVYALTSVTTTFVVPALCTWGGGSTRQLMWITPDSFWPIFLEYRAAGVPAISGDRFR